MSVDIGASTSPNLQHNEKDPFVLIEQRVGAIDVTPIGYVKAMLSCKLLRHGKSLDPCLGLGVTERS